MATNTERTIYIMQLRDKFTAPMRRINAATNRYNRAITTAQTRTKALGGGFKILGLAAATAAGVGIFRMISSLSELVGKFQLVEAAINVLVGPVLGKKLLEWAKEFSRSTVITFDQTIQSIKKLAAFGLPENLLRGLTKNLAEISSAIGPEKAPFLSLALGQVFTKGRLFAQEVRQFTEAGVGITDEIAKFIGRTPREVTELISQGAISFDIVAGALQNMTEEGGRFEGALAAAAKTWSGATAILGSTFDLLVVEVFEPFFDEMTKLVTRLSNRLQELRRIDFSGVTDAFIDRQKKLFERLFGGFDLGTLALTKFVLLFIEFSTIINRVVVLFSATLVKFGQAALFLLRAFGKAQILDFTGAKEDVLKAGDALSGAFDLSKDFVKGIRDTVTEILALKLAPVTPPEAVAKNVFSKDLLGADPNGEKEKLRRTSRLIGTGARDININIGNLIETVNNNNTTFDKNVEALNEHLRRALLTVVNDVSTTVE